MDNVFGHIYTGAMPHGEALSNSMPCLLAPSSCHLLKMNPLKWHRACAHYFPGLPCLLVHSWRNLKVATLPHFQDLVHMAQEKVDVASFTVMVPIMAERKQHVQALRVRWRAITILL